MTKQSSNQAERTCVGCRRVDSPDALLRVVLAPPGFLPSPADPAPAHPTAVPSESGDGEAKKSRDEHELGTLVVDTSAKLPGRGAWVCPSVKCFRTALKKGGFARSFKAPVRADADELVEMARVQLRKRLDGLIVAAKRARAVAVGTDAVRDSLSDPWRRPDTLLVAGDAAGRREELTEIAARLGSRCAVFGDKTWLGRLFDRAEVGIIAVLDEGIAFEIARTVERLRALSEDDG